jgi:LacI family transcriptional regulator
MSNILRVARAAGVSAMTVSRYFNDPAKLRPETRARVAAAVEALRYVPNAAARSLIQGRTDTVALIVADITNAFFTTVARGVEDVAQQHGYTMILGNADETHEKERAYLGVMVSRRVDGVILSPAGDDGGNLEILVAHEIPVVLVDRRIDTADVDVVRGDSRAAGHALTRHLIDLGHGRIAFLGGPAGVSSLEDRLAGYREALAEAGLAPIVQLGRYDRGSGEEIIEAQLRAAAPLPFTAVVAANDKVGVGVIAALARHALRVPADVSLVCFEDSESDTVVDPFLTVAVQPAYEIGQRAMGLLLDRMRGAQEPPREVVLPITMITRRSTAPARV